MTIDLVREPLSDLSSQPTSKFGPLVGDGGTTFRLWAPSLVRAEVELKDHGAILMQPGEDGFLSVNVPQCRPGALYRFRAGGKSFPDPASRQQASDADGWSVVREPMGLPSRHTPLRPWHETIICEVHVGTVTPEGTFAALTGRLEHFRDAGYTCLELMPLNEFPGGRNWGYDGTLLFAPDASYGTPEELRALVDRAHELGLCVVHDVVYNHFGETDNFIAHYAPEWFDPAVETPWGPGINFNQAMVRQFYYENACMWLTEYDFDGLRFDSVHEIGTAQRTRFLTELAATAHKAKNHAKLIIENMDNLAVWLERDAENRPKTYVAQWNDDVHHVLEHLVTGETSKGYDEPDKDPIADLQKALADGFVHDGQAEGPSDGHTRGEPGSLLPPDAFISYVQNHDQIGNRGDSGRLALRINQQKQEFLRFVQFLAPQIPLFFMGEEGQLGTPFPFFIDLPPGPAGAKRADRKKQMEEIFKQPLPPGGLPDPNDPETFQVAKLRWADFDSGIAREALEEFRRMAQWRRERVWPLAQTVCLDAQTQRSGSGLLVRWTYKGGTLCLALNAGDSPAVLTADDVTDPVWCGGVETAAGQIRLQAWSAISWTLPATGS